VLFLSQMAHAEKPRFYTLAEGTVERSAPLGSLTSEVIGIVEETSRVISLVTEINSGIVSHFVRNAKGQGFWVTQNARPTRGFRKAS